MENDKVMALANEHWQFIEKILKAVDELDEEQMNLCKTLYLEAFVHGYKHCDEGD